MVDERENDAVTPADVFDCTAAAPGSEFVPGLVGQLVAEQTRVRRLDRRWVGRRRVLATTGRMAGRAGPRPRMDGGGRRRRR